MEFTVNATRFDPYKNFKFRVKWDGRYVAGIHKVSAFKRTTQVIKHRQGGDNSIQMLAPGASAHEAITFERGLTHDPEFENWAFKIWNYGAGAGAQQSLADFRKDIILEVQNEAGRSRCPTRSIAAGCPNTRCPSSTPTPTVSRSSTSRWKTKAGNAT
jgi:phage tail-like protein